MGDRTLIEPIGNVHGILGKFIYINASYKAEMPEALNIITAPSALISNLDRLRSWPRGVAERQLEGGSKEKTEAAEQETPGRLGESSWQSSVPLSRSSLRGQRLLALGVLSTLRGVFMDYLRFHGTCGGVPARQGIEQKNVHDMESSTRIRNTIQDPKFRNSRSRRSSNPDEAV